MTESEVNQKLPIAKEVFSFFKSKYGEEAAYLILEKMVDYFAKPKPTVFEGIKVGERAYGGGLH